MVASEQCEAKCLIQMFIDREWKFWWAKNNEWRKWQHSCPHNCKYRL